MSEDKSNPVLVEMAYAVTLDDTMTVHQKSIAHMVILRAHAYLNMPEQYAKRPSGFATKDFDNEVNYDKT